MFQQRTGLSPCHLCLWCGLCITVSMLFLSAQFECGWLYLAGEHATACLLPARLGSDCAFSLLRRGGSFFTELGHRFKLQCGTNDPQPVTYHHPSGSVHIRPVTVSWMGAFSMRCPLKSIPASILSCFWCIFQMPLGFMMINNTLNLRAKRLKSLNLSKCDKRVLQHEMFYCLLYNTISPLQ